MPDARFQISESTPALPLLADLPQLLLNGSLAVDDPGQEGFAACLGCWGFRGFTGLGILGFGVGRAYDRVWSVESSK